METPINPPCFPTNWNVRFLCDCRKQDKEISIHHGIAHELSTQGISILSDHHICHQKKVAMQLIIPPHLKGSPQKIIKIIGRSIITIVREGQFMTQIEFRHFEEDGLSELEKSLRQHFNSHFFLTNAQRA